MVQRDIPDPKMNMPVFIDIEASSLGSSSYPIQIGRNSDTLFSEMLATNTETVDVKVILNRLKETAALISPAIHGEDADVRYLITLHKLVEEYSSYSRII